MIKAKGVDLEMLTVKSILRQIGRLPAARQIAVLEYALLHLEANVATPPPPAPEERQAALKLTGAQRAG